MKRLLPISVFLAAVVGLASAQDSTNTPAAPPAAGNVETNGEVTIESESLKAVFTNKMLVAVYRGNVRVHHPRWWFRSELSRRREAHRELGAGIERFHCQLGREGPHQYRAR